MFLPSPTPGVGDVCTYTAVTACANSALLRGDEFDRGVCVCECTEPCVYACCIAQQSPAGALAFWDRAVQCVSRALLRTLHPLLCSTNAAVSRPLIFCCSVQPLPQRGRWARKHERWISVDNASQNRMQVGPKGMSSAYKPSVPPLPSGHAFSITLSLRRQI